MMRRVSLLSASVLALGVVVVGCDGGSDDPSFGDYGGEVQLLNITLGGTNIATGSAFFYSEYTPNTGDPLPESNPYGALPVDTCVPSTAGSTATDGTFTSISVGPNVRIVGDGGTLTWNALAPGVYIGGQGPGSDVPPGSTADVEWDSPSTTLADAIDLPAAITITAPDPASQFAVVPTTGDFTFTWNSFGSDEVLISFQGNPGGLCRVADDGSFAVPAAFVSAINTTDNDLVLLLATNVGFEDVVLGTSEAFSKSVHTIGIVGRAWVMQ